MMEPRVRPVMRPMRLLLEREGAGGELVGDEDEDGGRVLVEDAKGVDVVGSVEVEVGDADSEGAVVVDGRFDEVVRVDGRGCSEVERGAEWVDVATTDEVGAEDLPLCGLEFTDVVGIEDEVTVNIEVIVTIDIDGAGDGGARASCRRAREGM